MSEGLPHLTTARRRSIVVPPGFGLRQSSAAFQPRAQRPATMQKRRCGLMSRFRRQAFVRSSAFRRFPVAVSGSVPPEGLILTQIFYLQLQNPQRGFNHSAQGCEERATLGERVKCMTTLKGLAFLKSKPY